MNSETYAVTTTPLIEWRGCAGTISQAGNSIDVSCDVSVTRTGVIEIVVADLPMTTDNWWIVKSLGDHRGLLMADYELNVRAPNGDELRTSALHILSSATPVGPEGAFVRLRGQAAGLSVTNERTAECDQASVGATAIYHTFALKAHGSETVETDIGRVTLSGAANVEDYSILAGSLRFDNPGVEAQNVHDWLLSADERARDILLVISLGAGRFVRWGVREFFVGGIRRSTEFLGPHRTGAPYDPLFHHLVLTEKLDFAANKYSRSLGERTGLDVAIEWFVMNHSYTEARFLATMCSLEHIVSKHPELGGSLLPTAAFRALRRALEDLLDSSDLKGLIVGAMPASPEPQEDALFNAIGQLRRKLGNLNGRSLQERAVAVFRHYRVPTDDVSPSIAVLVGTRNRLVHRGVHGEDSDDPELLVALSALRELLRRLFMAILDYKGPYYTFLNGPALARFEKLPNRVEA